MKDKYGRLVKIGSKVAFNYSGAVHFGVIVNITERTGRIRDYSVTIFHVRSIGSGEISKVTNINNLAVLP
jgi:hypothetical protein